MGIFPYQSPAEYKAMQAHIAMQHEFIESRGWHKSYTVNELGHCVYPKELKAPNGKIYSNTEEFKKEEGWFPDIVKDGRLGNTYLELDKENFIEPIYDEKAFLMSKGYIRHPDLVKDYMENIDATELYYKTFGFVPRWIDPEGKPVGHEESLAKEGYSYPFGKSDNDNLKITNPEYVPRNIQEIWGLKEPY